MAGGVLGADSCCGALIKAVVLAVADAGWRMSGVTLRERLAGCPSAWPLFRVPAGMRRAKAHE